MKTVRHEILHRLQGLSCLKFMAAALFTMAELQSTQKEVLFLLKHFKPSLVDIKCHLANQSYFQS